MTPYEKIRAALELADSFDDAYSTSSERDAKNEAMESALATLAELEKSQTPAPVAEIREPTPEECERIYAFWLNSEGCNGRTLGERMGGLTFNAVRAVMWPKSEG